MKTYSENIEGFVVETFGRDSAVLKEFRKRNKELGIINLEE